MPYVQCSFTFVSFIAQFCLISLTAAWTGIQLSYRLRFEKGGDTLFSLRKQRLVIYNFTGYLGRFDSKMDTKEQDPTLHLPRILCLHGGGVNAQIFRLQCRVLISQLKSTFRLCFANGPFICSPGPGMIPVYKDNGPFRRWLRWLPEHEKLDAGTIAALIMKQLKEAMDGDNAMGATGKWVGVLGFSQGAKVAASVILKQQRRAKALGEEEGTSRFRFAVIMAGRSPLVSLEPEHFMNPKLASPAQTTLENLDSTGESNCEKCNDHSHILRLPTIHVHGRQDQGLHLHRQLLEQYCEPTRTRLIEWEGDHRVPFKRKDVAAVVEQILDVGKETGSLINM